MSVFMMKLGVTSTHTLNVNIKMDKIKHSMRTRKSVMRNTGGNNWFPHQSISTPNVKAWTIIQKLQKLHQVSIIGLFTKIRFEK